MSTFTDQLATMQAWTLLCPDGRRVVFFGTYAAANQHAQRIGASYITQAKP